MLMTHLKRTLELTSCLISSITSLDTSLVRSMPVTLKRKGYVEVLTGEMNLGSQLEGREGERPSHGPLAAKVTSSTIFTSCHTLRLLYLRAGHYCPILSHLNISIYRGTIACNFPQSAKIASRAQNLTENQLKT